MNTSHIGYLLYGDHTDRMYPIQAVRLDDGKINFYAEYTTGPDEIVHLDAAAACTIIGVDGSQIAWVPPSDTPKIYTASHGGIMHIHQSQRLLSAERSTESP